MGRKKAADWYGFFTALHWAANEKSDLRGLSISIWFVRLPLRDSLLLGVFYTEYTLRSGAKQNPPFQVLNVCSGNLERLPTVRKTSWGLAVRLNL